MRTEKVSYKWFGCLAAGVASLFFAVNGMANIGIVKAYKETFPGEKPKCTHCHVDKSPKKEEGRHEFNEYGKKVFAAKNELKKEKVDGEVLSKVGKGEATE
ncbi:MAG: hypothetical protein HYT89_00975 [Candidatus Omnitrophica bacterium]|nr:hypothetical protein [Candidatus Omnitrophota bacterium]